MVTHGNVTLDDVDFNNFIVAATRTNNDNLIGDETKLLTTDGKHASVFPLKSWVEAEESIATIRDQSLRHQLAKAAMLRKITIAYAIGHLLHHLKISVSGYSQAECQPLFRRQFFGPCFNRWSI